MFIGLPPTFCIRGIGASTKVFPVLMALGGFHNGPHPRPEGVRPGIVPIIEDRDEKSGFMPVRTSKTIPHLTDQNRILERDLEDHADLKFDAGTNTRAAHGSVDYMGFCACS